MDQFDPQITGLMEGDITGVVVSDPQPFVGGVSNKVVDPTKDFTLTIEWELFGQLVPLWLAALSGNWDVSVYAESLGGGNEVRLGSATVPSSATQPCTVNQSKVNCTRYSTTVTVPAGKLQEHIPGTDRGGIYKLAVAVFLNSSLSGTPGYDLVGFREGPIIQAENPA
jgi:hypothetical protein